MFLDHLVAEAALCARAGKPMHFLGVGVQAEAETAAPELRALCAQATRNLDPRYGVRRTADPARPAGVVNAGADLAHLCFRNRPPPAAAPGRLTLVANFDYGTWPGQAAFLRALEDHPAPDRVWLAQESRTLPGDERALFAALPAAEQARWRLVAPESPGAPLDEVLARWPSANGS